ncbi:MAG: efflux RND transporter periplasmic adaptor subunit [Deltaproteobacteria bacterium]|nr:efflux RND transporter periplasmic adaptor subunit [Deltaproteobacteria bacterium]MBW2416336.1 efflux RND transporter periplasmic adaptor subunit [Deltaproteobacteria bacterium]
MSLGFTFWRASEPEEPERPDASVRFDSRRSADAANDGTSALTSAISDTVEFVAPDNEGRSGEPRGAKGDLPMPFDCIIEPSEIADVGSPVTGVIETIYVERGDEVEAGQVVAELESGAEKAAVRVARARARMDGDVRSREASLALGAQRRERAKELFEHNALSLDLRQEIETEAVLAELELTRAREEKDLAKLELERAIEALKRRTVRSPIPGVVVERMLSPGEVVDEEPILKIAQLDPLRIEVILPSAMFGTVKVGMWGAVIPEMPGDRVHAALVTIVDKVVDAASGTFGVRLELRNKEREIPGGLHCRVSFLRE